MYLIYLIIIHPASSSADKILTNVFSRTGKRRPTSERSAFNSHSRSDISITAVISQYDDSITLAAPSYFVTVRAKKAARRHRLRANVYLMWREGKLVYQRSGEKEIRERARLQHDDV